MSNKFNNIIKLIKQHGTKRPNKGEKSLLSRDDIDMLLHLNKNDGKRSYLHRLQKRCLMQQLKVSILKERVFEALNKLNDMVTPSSSEPPLDKQKRLEELLSQISQSTQTIDCDSNKINKKPLSSNPEAFVIADITHNHTTKLLKSRINRSPEIEKNGKNSKNSKNFKNSENNARKSIIQPEVEIVFKGLPSIEQEVIILQAISKKLADAYEIAKSAFLSKYKTVKLEYYVNYEDIIDVFTVAVVLSIANNWYLPQTFILQYLSLDEIKSAGTFYILRPFKGDYEKANYLKLRLNPELLANLFKIPTPENKVDIHIFESELIREEMELKGCTSDHAMKQLLHTLVKTWSTNPSLYDSRLRFKNSSNRIVSLTSKKSQTTKSRRKCPVSSVRKKFEFVDRRHFDKLDFGMKVKTILVPGVQVALFIVFVYSFIAFEYTCL